MPRWIYALLAAGAIAVAGQILSAPPLLVFAAACIGLVPLAGLIGHATGQIAAHTGAQWGGLLNATFGNAAELIITVLALREGLFTLVKASITGSIIGNTLLVLGLALLVGGLKHGLLKFDPRLASLNASLMILAVASLLLPAVFGSLVQSRSRVETLSVVVAVILLLSYLAYLLFLLLGRAAWPGKEEAVDEPHTTASWSVRRGIVTLGAATVATAIVSEVLVQAVTPVTTQLGASRAARSRVEQRDLGVHRARR